MAARRVASALTLGRRAAALSGLAVLPVFVNVAMLVLEPRSNGGVAYDFRVAFLPAARAVAHGRSPFGAAVVAALAPGTAFVYPPVAAFVLVPFTWVPAQVAAYALSILVLACAPATLYVLGVRDWRCYGASLMWAPVWESVRFGALSLPLALLLAVAWKHRQRIAPVAAALAGAIALKLFVWPLLVWLGATRRWKSLAAVALAAGALVVLPWAALGFAGFTVYPRLLRVLSSIEAPESYTIGGVVRKLGLGWDAGQIVAYAAGALLLAAAARAARRTDDRTSFVLVVCAALVLSPIVWMHYFALLLVPVAIMSPSFGLPWLLPATLFAFPITPGAASWQAIATALTIAAATLVTSAGYRPPLRMPAPAPAP